MGRVKERGEVRRGEGEPIAEEEFIFRGGLNPEKNGETTKADSRLWADTRKKGGRS